jgi:hypothetical protein
VRISDLKKALVLMEDLNQAIYSSNRLNDVTKLNCLILHGFKSGEGAKGKPAQVAESFTIQDIDSSHYIDFLVTHYADLIESLCVKLGLLGIDTNSIEEYINENIKE